MGKLETLTVAIPEDLAATIRAAVERGDYDSVSDAVTGALYAWQFQFDEDPAETERLRELVQEGIASGPGTGLSGEDLLAEIKRRHAERQR